MLVFTSNLRASVNSFIAPSEKTLRLFGMDDDEHKLDETTVDHPRSLHRGYIKAPPSPLATSDFCHSAE